MSANGPTITISSDVARRFLLGHQGLWPRRRWRGRDGTLEAVRHIGAVQMDPLTIVARSHDLVLWSRVAGYRPAMLQHHLYADRTLFDYGGVLRIQSIEELPHWRLHMERRREDARYYTPLFRHHPDLFDAVREVVEREGPLPARAIAKLVELDAPQRTTKGAARGSYRSGSVVGRVAYQLWMTGELMTHHREGFERHFDLAERIAPADLLIASDGATARDFFARKIVGQAGLITPGSWRSAMAYALERKIDRTEATAWIDRLVADGEAITVRIDGHRGHYLVPGDAAAQLRDLADGRVPAGWKGRRSTKTAEARLLSPLDPIVRRERAKAFFDFEHIWEIYKPAEKRRWGPFTMPLLYGDGLVGRVDPRIDRETGTLHLNGIWLDVPDLAGDPAFATALTSGIRDLATFVGAERTELHHCDPTPLRLRLESLKEPSQERGE